MRGFRQLDLAKSLGIAQTTIANYERKLRFPDERMLGRFADFFGVSLDFLLGRADVMRKPEVGAAQVRLEPPSPAFGPAAEYLEILRTRGFEAARSFAESTVGNGTSYQRICLEVFEPALKEVGRLWELGQLSVGEEHVISEATSNIMANLFPAPHSGPRRKERPLCVCLAVSREQHVIAATMVADFLRLSGWSVVFPGANLSIGHVVGLLAAELPDLCAISVTLLENVTEAHELIAAIRKTESLRAMRIMVGGQAFQSHPELWKDIGADDTAVNAERAVLVANRLIGPRT